MSAAARSDQEWQRVLNPDEYNVLRCRHTEPAGSGEYITAFPENGHFACRACAQPLYSVGSKFACNCGWPAFSRCFEGALRCEPDLENFEMCGGRVEIVCCSCASHLGHIFFEATDGGPKKTERHCVNSLSIRWNADAPDAARAEQSLRREYDACMDKMLRVLSGMPAEEEPPARPP